jgi:hypothetical protein
MHSSSTSRNVAKVLRRGNGHEVSAGLTAGLGGEDGELLHREESAHGIPNIV